MKNSLLLLVTIITFSCHKTETVKTSLPASTQKVIAKDTTKAIETNTISDSITCIDVVLEILRTAPSYVESTKGLYEAVVKNGGTSYGITVEGSPNPERDKAREYSETYVLSLHESYPDRMPTIARYTFDASKNELYEYDTLNDSLIAIAYNKDLLQKYRTICK